jgi:pimeloyl-ACP methyl ester carboxylesterase
VDTAARLTAVKHLPRVETVVIEKAGHLVHLDQPAAFIETVTAAWRSAGVR